MIVATPSGDVAAIASPATTGGPWVSLPTQTLSGPSVTPESAMALTSVFAAVSNIAWACGTMPLQIIERDEDGPGKIDTSSQTALMLGVQPNPDHTAVDLWVYVFTSLLLRGNAYIVKVKDHDGIVRELWPLPPAQVTPWRNERGRKLLRVRQLNGNRYVERDYTTDQILHIKGLSITDPLVGESPITILRNRFGAHLAQSDHHATSYANGLQLRGVLSTPASSLTPEGVKMMKEQWKAALASKDDIAFLHSGMKFEPVTMSLADAQFIESVKWSHAETALAFGLPASRLNGDTGNSNRYANMSQDDLFTFKQAYLPRLEVTEAALQCDEMFGAASRFAPRFNPDQQLRADPRERWEIHKIRREIGAASTNDVLRDEDQPTIGKAGDDYSPLRAGGATTKPAARSSDEPPSALVSESDTASSTQTRPEP